MMALDTRVQWGRSRGEARLQISLAGDSPRLVLLLDRARLWQHFWLRDRHRMTDLAAR